MSSTHQTIAALSAWANSAYAPNEIGTELHMRRLVAKLAERVGSVNTELAAIWSNDESGSASQSKYDLLDALLDTAIDALIAHESLTGSVAMTEQALSERVMRRINAQWISVVPDKLDHYT